MVGRPGRSKGCFNCRRKKKGCDLVRPSCGQCIKSKVACKGYDEKLDVILYTPAESKAQTALRNSATEVAYVGTFWELLIPTTSRASRTSDRDWTRVVRDHYTSDGILKDAMLALTFSRIGKHSGNEDVARYGLIRYNTCLRELTRQINLQNGICSDETISACLILSLYEIMCSSASQGANWLNHMRGIETFFQLRGPQAFTSGIAHYLFVGARLNIISAAVMNRRATVFDSTAWLKVPWSLGMTTKSMFDKIVDLIAHIPRILEMLDEIEITKPDQGRDPEPLLKACWKLDAQLQTWFRELTEIHAESYVDRTGSSYPAPDFYAPLTADAEINHEYAQALSVYWMTCCFLHTTLCLAWEATDSPLYLLPKRIDPVQYATLISKSLPYFSAPGAGEGCLVFYAVCIGIALHVFAITDQASSPDSARLSNIFDPKVVAEGIGRHIGYYLRTLAASMVGTKIDLNSRRDDERMTELAKKWWGGGALVTLHSRKATSMIVKRTDLRITETPWSMLP